MFQTNIFVKYTDGTPVSYQIWNSYWIKYQTLQITPKINKIFTNYFQRSYVEKTEIAQRRLQPELHYTNSCVVMLTAVLTEPDWITVPCENKFSDLILCHKIINYSPDKGHMINNNPLLEFWCDEGHLLIENKCILFKKYSNVTNLLNTYEILKYNSIFTIFDFDQNVNASYFECFSLIQHFFMQPIQFILPFSSHNILLAYTAVHSSMYGKLNWISKIHRSNKTISQYEGYLLFPAPLSQFKVPATLFKCSDGSYIDETLVCNGMNDCNERNDEQNGICKNESSYLVCKFNCYSNLEKCTCSDFFFQCSSSQVCIAYLLVCDGHNDCQHGEDEICSSNISKNTGESPNMLHNETDLFKCTTSGFSILMSYVDGLIPDCPNSFEDELQYFSF